MINLTKLTMCMVTVIIALAVLPQAAKADYLRSKADMSKCLGVADGRNGSQLRIEDCQMGVATSQQWTYNGRSGLISNDAYPTKCLHKATRGWGRNNRIHLWTCGDGTAEMKTWRINGSNGTITARENDEMCFRLAGEAFANGTTITLNGDCRSTLNVINWRRTSKDQLDCAIFDTLVRPNLRRVHTMIDEFLPYEHKINRRKTLVTHRVKSVSINGCDAWITVDATMRRKIRRNASGYVILKAKLHSVGLNYICLRNPKVKSVKLSNLGFIGEGFYQRRGTKGLPNEMCVAF